MEEAGYLILIPIQAEIREGLGESNVENAGACKKVESDHSQPYGKGQAWAALGPVFVKPLDETVLAGQPDMYLQESRNMI